MSARQQQFSFPFGFLVIGLLWGLATGYVIADWSSHSIGFEWYQNPYPRYANFTIRCLVIGPIVGLLLGIILDGFIRDNRFRKIALEIATTVLVFFVVFYLLFLSSAMIQVRE